MGLWVSGDELDEDVFAAISLVAELFGLRQHFADDFLLGSGLQANVQKAGAGDLDRIHPFLESGCGFQRGFELLTQSARVRLQGLGQLHGCRTSEIAMGCHFGVFKRSACASAGRECFELSSQGREQFLFDGKHPVILRGCLDLRS